MLNVYSAEVTAAMYEAVNDIIKATHACNMIRTQSSPAPFIIHMRTLLLMFCFTFPFTIIGTVRPLSLVFINGCVSFGLLGIEFCSREMEHPFGGDQADIPIHQVLNVARHSVRAVRNMHNAKLVSEETQAMQ
eukprot:gnl/MRDRNA2_/MRDRNA2_85786_c0_seq2.p1 gnl/MRDRNA2_/MRDRNA2_85786_c0~~gnl/MRDRNA2_/MRDRNA2_85786_c0_seq2.p1  ORF type:complete len:133 (-),score=10.69 gnl/MRDRNA2_/MRDRNA2_85786_c0_seq2:409-807(-)